jgi:hypothetical protein
VLIGLAAVALSGDLLARVMQERELIGSGKRMSGHRCVLRDAAHNERAHRALSNVTEKKLNATSKSLDLRRRYWPNFRRWSAQAPNNLRYFPSYFVLEHPAWRARAHF